MVYIITRHPAAVQWVREKMGYSKAIAISHVDSSFLVGLRPFDVVMGVAPPHIMEEVCEITRTPFGVISMDTPHELRGVELTLEQMLQCQPCLKWYKVEACSQP